MLQVFNSNCRVRQSAALTPRNQLACLHIWGDSSAHWSVYTGRLQLQTIPNLTLQVQFIERLYSNCVERCQLQSCRLPLLKNIHTSDDLCGSTQLQLFCFMSTTAALFFFCLLAAGKPSLKVHIATSQKVMMDLFISYLSRLNHHWLSVRFRADLKILLLVLKPSAVGLLPLPCFYSDALINLFWKCAV